MKWQNIVVRSERVAGGCDPALIDFGVRALELLGDGPTAIVPTSQLSFALDIEFGLIDPSTTWERLNVLARLPKAEAYCQCRAGSTSLTFGEDHWAYSPTRVCLFLMTPRWNAELTALVRELGLTMEVVVQAWRPPGEVERSSSNRVAPLKVKKMLLSELRFSGVAELSIQDFAVGGGSVLDQLDFIAATLSDGFFSFAAAFGTRTEAVNMSHAHQVHEAALSADSGDEDNDFDLLPRRWDLFSLPVWTVEVHLPFDERAVKYESSVLNAWRTLSTRYEALVVVSTETVQAQQLGLARDDSDVYTSEWTLIHRLHTGALPLEIYRRRGQTSRFSDRRQDVSDSISWESLVLRISSSQVL